MNPGAKQVRLRGWLPLAYSGPVRCLSLQSSGGGSKRRRLEGELEILQEAPRTFEQDSSGRLVQYSLQSHLLTLKLRTKKVFRTVHHFVRWL